MNSSPQQIRRLLDAAYAPEPEHRQAFLAALDPDLRKEVESLLAAEGDSFLEKTPPAVHFVAPETVEKSTGIRPPSAQTKTPDRIGPYRMAVGPRRLVRRLAWALSFSL